LARIAASIGILIVHTPPYQPEGLKIERLFRSAREQFLASLDPKVLLSIEQLNERLSWPSNRMAQVLERPPLTVGPVPLFPVAMTPGDRVIRE